MMLVPEYDSEARWPFGMSYDRLNGLIRMTLPGSCILIFALK